MVWVKAPTDPGREGVVERKDDLHPESYWVVVGDSVLHRNRKHLYVLQEIPQKEKDDSILPLALDWYCDAPGENVHHDNGVNMNPVVHLI